MVGSRAHGLEQEESDRDYRFVYTVPAADLLRLYGEGEKPPRTSWSEGQEQDTTGFEVGHFLDLARRCNPNILEVFIAPVQEVTGAGHDLAGLFPHVLSKKAVMAAYRGYSSNQRQKLLDKNTEAPPIKLAKFGTAAIRSAWQGYVLLTEGRLPLAYQDRKIFKELLGIRDGEWSSGRIVDYLNEWHEKMLSVYHKSDLPESPNLEVLNDFLLRIRECSLTPKGTTLNNHELTLVKDRVDDLHDLVCRLHRNHVVQKNSKAIEGIRKSLSKAPEERQFKGRTLIGFVLDRSGSMDSVRDDTIGGFNTWLEGLQKVSSEALLTLTCFDTFVETPFVNTPIKEVPKLTPETYVPGGWTALYDAIGSAVTAIDKEATGDDRVLLIIQTDGQENSSREFTKEAIFNLINSRQQGNWTVTYLSAGPDAFTEAAKIGIYVGNTMAYRGDKAGTQTTFATVAAASADYASGVSGTVKDFYQSDDPDRS